MNISKNEYLNALKTKGVLNERRISILKAFSESRAGRKKRRTNKEAYRRSRSESRSRAEKLDEILSPKKKPSEKNGWLFKCNRVTQALEQKA